MAGQFSPPTGHVFRVERARGPVWYAKYRLPDGRQVQKKIGPAWTARGRPACPCDVAGETAASRLVLRGRGTSCPDLISSLRGRAAPSSSAAKIAASGAVRATWRC